MVPAALLVLLAGLAAGQRIRDSIYSDIQQIRPCFRRLNGSQEVGCSSALGGNVGVVAYLERESDLAALDPAFGPYVLLVDPAILSGGLLRRARASGQVVGVVLPSVTEGNWTGHYPAGGYSADVSCPNAGSSFYANTSEQCSELASPWNPSGAGTMWEDWGFPIFLVQEAAATEGLLDCWLQHNQPPLGWPLCSVELKANMYAAKDSQTCIRRSNLFNLTPLTMCDPLGDSNTVYFAAPRNKTTASNGTRVESDRSVIVVAARMDALALFDQVEVGFDSPSTGLVTLLATAELVAKALRTGINFKEGVENIMFLLLQGESFDYIGSSRMVYDMQNDAFPFNLTEALAESRFLHNGTQPLLAPGKVRAWVELGQLGTGRPGPSPPPIYLHARGAADDVLAALESNRAGLEVRRSQAGAALPPCSAQSVLKELPDLPTVLVTNFDTEFRGDMYHSIYDSAAYHGYNYSKGAGQPVVQRLADVAAMAAAGVLALASDERVPKLKDQAGRINELLHCYTMTANCTMFHEASEPGNFPWLGGPPTKVPFAQYVGVRMGAHTMMTRLVLQYLTGQPVEKEEVQGIEEVKEGGPDIEQARADCLARNKQQNVYSYVFLVGKDCYNRTLEVVECGTCYSTTVTSTPASSPAFLPGVSATYGWTSGTFPTWTESIWKVISARRFLQGDPRHDHGVLALGLLLLVSSLALVHWLERRAAVIFGEGGACREPGPVSM